MRIIAGKHRGRKLSEFDGQAVRPTADKVREAMFSRIQFAVSGSVFLDLFCGSGAVGIEAISRGAKKVVFIDNSPISIKLTKANLAAVKENGEVSCQNALSYLEQTGEKFDFIFIDPPYKSEVGKQALESIGKKDVLTENGTVIFETDSEYSAQTEGLVYEKTKKYGITYLNYYKAINKQL